MIKYMLDTNTCIFALRDRNPGVVDMLLEFSDVIAISSIVLAELYFGCAASGQPARHSRILNEFCQSVPVISFDDNAAKIYGSIRAQLKESHFTVGDNDILIAASAVANNSVLVTNNIKDFVKMDGVKFEDWVIR